MQSYDESECTERPVNIQDLEPPPPSPEIHRDARWAPERYQLDTCRSMPTCKTTAYSYLPPDFIEERGATLRTVWTAARPSSSQQRSIYPQDTPMDTILREGGAERGVRRPRGSRFLRPRGSSSLAASRGSYRYSRSSMVMMVMSTCFKGRGVRFLRRIEG